MASRPSWDDYFMDITHRVASRSTCLRRQVGAVIVLDKRILSTGCLRERMGIPSGQRQEICRGLHAEQNAILQAALHGVSVAGGTLYVTHQPCITCAKMIINAGLERVVCAQSYPDELARSFLAEAGIELELWTPESQSEAGSQTRDGGAPKH